MGDLSGQWGVILGASSGFGAAAALELARHGMSIYGVHLDRRSTLENVERIAAQVKAAGVECRFFNVNAADDAQRADVIRQIKEGGGAPARLLFHSLAFGTLKPYVADNPADQVTRKQMEMTLDVMAHSLVYWTQDLLGAGLLSEGARIYAMTSAGGARVWATYGPVSAAKAALESHVRQLAYELAPRAITVNAIRAGVTDTPSLRKIPGNEQIVAQAVKSNPFRRLTTPEDVARAVAALALPGTAWMTGNVIGVDGAEFVV